MLCPFPLSDYPQITLAHGGGGRLSQILIEKLFIPCFQENVPPASHDGAILCGLQGPLAFSTDAFVVTPLFFPGGDIGKLAVYGTVNDLAMCGAKAQYMSASFILEEGLSTEVLHSVVRSMGDAAREVGVRIVTGDTKVVERGKCDGLYISTSAVGELRTPQAITPETICSGDVILLSGDLGRHGIAVLSEREGFQFKSKIQSDCAPLWNSVETLLQAQVPVHCLRDLTRGGLASALVEISEACGLEMEVDEAAIPVSAEVRGASEMLGLEPIHIANEGRFIAFVPEHEVTRASALLRSAKLNPVNIGRVLAPREGQKSRVWLKGFLGQKRLLDMLSGEQLPRIC